MKTTDSDTKQKPDAFKRMDQPAFIGALCRLAKTGDIWETALR